MIVRSLDVDGDWNFGKGKNDYLKDLPAVAQNVSTRLNCYLGDCFFDIAAGIDWFNRLGSKDQVGLNLEINAVILNTKNVTGLVALSTVLDKNRKITGSYDVSTVFPGTLKGEIG